MTNIREDEMFMKSFCQTYGATPHCRTKLSKILAKLFEYLVIICIGGFAYVGIELLYRGHSHWSMFVVGGLCLLCIGLLNEFAFTNKMGIIKQMAIGAIIITLFEFIAGLILNVWLGLGVWDYSNMPFNIMGQICLPFTIAWFFLSYVAIRVDDEIRYRLFDEPRPEYALWSAW